MSDYSTIKTRVLQLLGDPDGVRYDDATLQEALRQALTAYTRSCPQIRSQVLTLASSGQEQSLAELTNPPLFLLEVIHPYLNGSTDYPPQPPALHPGLRGWHRLAAFPGGEHPAGGRAGARGLWHQPHPRRAGRCRNQQRPRKPRGGARHGRGGLRRPAAHP